LKNKTYFQDKVVIITGASSGIGRATALALARLQAKVVLAALNGEKLAALQEADQAPGRPGLPYLKDRREEKRKRESR
jgi:NAD(P)-dependent dehydrogenase (short-subunit alcohol dehydrogenase family)